MSKNEKEAKRYFVVTTIDHPLSEGMWDGCDRGIETSEDQYEGCPLGQSDYCEELDFED